MKLLTPSLRFDMTTDEATSLFHICTYVSNDAAVGSIMREEARQLADALTSFDINKLGDRNK